LSHQAGVSVPGAPEVDAERVIAELRELDELTGGRDRGGAQRVAWGPVWAEAREWMAGKLAEIGAEAETDEAGNVWATLRGAEADGGAPAEPALALGSHLDSVPDGGWLDGALGVVAGLGVLRAWSENPSPPPRDLVLIDFADEEGSRFGRSLLGSSALAGTLDPAAVAELTDEDGTGIAQALAAFDVDLARSTEASARLNRLGAYLELHIEQGPVLERDEISCAAVSGTAGVERLAFRFSGRASHAGTTPMGERRDAALAAAQLALAVEAIAIDAGGVGTTGTLSLDPNIVTAVAGTAEIGVDLRHAELAPLDAMLDAVRSVAAKVADDRRCVLAEIPIWRTDPIPFDADLVAAAAHCCEAQGGSAKPMPSGALHDAASLAPHVPTAMIFTSSADGVSHNRLEDTPDEHLLAGICAFADLAAIALNR
jgi:hydantoinase/carbamoylase family amidase